MTQPARAVPTRVQRSIDSEIGAPPQARWGVAQPPIREDVMAEKSMPESDLQRSREVAEASRETEWQGAGFMRDLFLGKFRLDLIHPYPLVESERPEFRRFYDALESFLKDHVDPGE